VEPVSASVQRRAGAPGLSHSPDTLEVGIGAFAVLSLALAILMAAAPHSFYTAVGPFGAYNGHYIRDLATFYAAVGAGLAISLRRISWRVPALAITTVQYGLHSVNHLLDISKAHPQWTGYFDFFSLAAATLLLAWLTRVAVEQARAPASDPRRPR
jgi:hypothetical protein